MDTLYQQEKEQCYHMAILYHNGTAVIAFLHWKFFLNSGSVYNNIIVFMHRKHKNYMFHLFARNELQLTSSKDELGF